MLRRTMSIELGDDDDGCRTVDWEFDVDGDDARRGEDEAKIDESASLFSAWGNATERIYFPIVDELTFER